MQSNTFNKVCKLQTDNFSTRDYWILTDGSNVNVCKQRNGQPAIVSMTIPIYHFNKLIEWYIKEQEL